MRNHKTIYKQVENFYNNSVITKFWELVKKQQMHVGYWDNQHPFKGDLYEGAKRFTDLMISLVDVKKGDLFIDIGCGFGLPGIQLAKIKECRVLGITASHYQAEIANQKAIEENISSNAVFITGNANVLPLSDNCFDSGWFLESIFHMGHEVALKEAHRVLKPGAPLLIADFIKTGNISKGDMGFLLNESGIRSTVTLNEYPVILKRNGFDLVELKEITENTIDKEGRWKIHIDIIKQRKDELVKLLDEKGYEYLRYFFNRLNKIGEKSIGYCLVKATNR